MILTISFDSSAAEFLLMFRFQLITVQTVNFFSPLAYEDAVLCNFHNQNRFYPVHEALPRNRLSVHACLCMLWMQCASAKVF